MLPIKSGSSIETQELGELTQFSIKASGKAFKTLISSLYSNKIQAVIRELSTNALDAHIEAGNRDLPFEVKLPTHFDTTFYVRDFGTGLTHNQMTHLYTTLFESSKENTNKQVGMLGLGSKSPFSYVDTFTTTSFLNGKVSTYSVFINEYFEPFITLIGVEDTNEPNGLKVELTANAGDVKAFQKEALDIYKWFTVKPKLVRSGVQTEDIIDVERVVEGNGWYIYNVNTYGSSASMAYAKQGCVVYPLRYSSIPNAPESVINLLSNNIVIEFPIGTIDVAPSREELSYDPVTCKNIVARVNSVSSELKERIEETLKHCSTRVEAVKKYHDLPNRLRIIADVTWNGYRVSDSTAQFYNKNAYLHGTSISPYKKEIDCEYLVQKCQRQYDSNVGCAIRKGSKHNVNAFAVDLLRDMCIYYTKKGVANKTNKLAQRTAKAYRLYSAQSRSSDLFYIHAIEDNSLAEIQKDLSGITFIDLSTIEPDKNTEKVVRRPPATKKTEVMAKQLLNGDLTSQGLVEVIGEAYFVMSTSDGWTDLQSNTIITTETIRNIYSVSPFYMCLSKFFSDKPIYVVSGTYAKRLSGMTDLTWTSLTPDLLFSVLKKEEIKLGKVRDLIDRFRGLNKLSPYLGTSALAEEVTNNLNNYSGVELTSFYSYLSLVEHFNSLLQSDVDISHVTKALKTLRNVSPQACSSINSCVDVSTSDLETTLDALTKVRMECLSKYPLLSNLNGDTSQKKVIDYVMMCESFNHNNLS